MRKISIKAKLTLLFSISLIIVIFTTFFTTVAISRRALQNDIKQNLKNVVESNAKEIEYTRQIYDEDIELGDQYLGYKDAYIEIDDDFMNEVDGIVTSLYDKDGNLLYGESKIDVDNVQIGEVLSVKSNNEKYFVYCYEIKGEYMEGLFLKGYVNANVKQTIITNVMHLSILMIPIFGIIVIVAGYIMAIRAISPISGICKSAESINDGNDLSKRIEIGEGKDEIHALADTFNKMFERLEKSFNDEKQFTTDISHELRTPITVVMAQSELALEEEGSEEHKKAFDIIYRQSGKMRKIVEAMLSFSRLERMTHLKEVKQVNLTELMWETVEIYQYNKEKNIRFSYEIQDDVIIRANKQLLAELLNNLIDNAYKYGVDNGKIRITLKQNLNEVEIIVEDDGIGISEEKLERIWNKFYQADEARTSNNMGSIGLGLAMVKRIVELHKGTIEVASQIGRGTKFKIIFKN